MTMSSWFSVRSGLLPDVVLVDALDVLARATVLRAGRRLCAEDPDAAARPMRR